MPRAVLLLLFGLLTTATAADLFREQIEPILSRDCLGCHGEAQTLSKLDLRSRASALHGGARGPAIVPGNAAASLLFQARQSKYSNTSAPGSTPSRNGRLRRRWPFHPQPALLLLDPGILPQCFP